jgi:3-oxoacyl-[acyl-carrier-protein] synthase II
MIKNRENKRVVVTGVGVVSPAGIGKVEFWKNISAGKSCISEITRFDTSRFKVNIAGEIRDFSPSRYLGIEADDESHRVELFGICAAKMAVEDSRLEIAALDPRRIGVCLGTSAGGMEITVSRLLHRTLSGNGHGAKEDMNHLSEYVSVLPGNLSASVAQSVAANAICLGFSTGCTASADAIGHAFEYIQGGLADVMIVGGSEAPIEPITVQAFDAIGTLSHRNDPQCSSRPFDKERDGFVIGEGAGILVLEERDFACRRGARIYSEIVGYETTCDAFHLTSSDPAMIASTKVILGALQQAGIEREQVNYITAHGSSTQMNDFRETETIKSVFGQHAYSVPITGLKSMIGHTSGAAAALQAVALTLALEHGFCPPTINYQVPDPKCDLNYVPNHGIPAHIRFALQNTYAYAGKNTAILYRKPEEALAA